MIPIAELKWESNGLPGKTRVHILGWVESHGRTGGYGEPNRSISEIATDLRASHAILAKGLLAAPKDMVIPEMNTVSVRFADMGREISVL